VNQPPDVTRGDAEGGEPSSTAAASWRGRGNLGDDHRPVATSTAVRSVKVPPTSIPTMNMGRMIHSFG
jgi:hypothetical protein